MSLKKPYPRFPYLRAMVCKPETSGLFYLYFLLVLVFYINGYQVLVVWVVLKLQQPCNN